MFYVLDEHHNLIEAYDKEGVLAVLAQAIADGSLSGITENSAFVSQLKCCVSGQANKVAFVTQAKFNEMKASDSLLANCLYFVTDDTTADDIDETLTELTDTVNGILKSVNDIISGETVVQRSALLTGGKVFKPIGYVSGNYIEMTETGVYLLVYTKEGKHLTSIITITSLTRQTTDSYMGALSTDGLVGYIPRQGDSSIPAKISGSTVCLYRAIKIMEIDKVIE